MYSTPPKDKKLSPNLTAKVKKFQPDHLVCRVTYRAIDFPCGFVREIPKKPIHLFSSIKQLINSPEKNSHGLSDWIDQPVQLKQHVHPSQGDKVDGTLFPRGESQGEGFTKATGSVHCSDVGRRSLPQHWKPGACFRAGIAGSFQSS